jgi:hypothetical protein|tara:strand:+ start:1967 stop:2170 length:204 start_codon:yes stop_codon:yes gene_type:complete
MNSWYGIAVNFKWPHDGFVLGISWDFFDWNDECPWTSCILRIGFISVLFDYGYGDENKDIYNNQKLQ